MIKGRKSIVFGISNSFDNRQAARGCPLCSPNRCRGRRYRRKSTTYSSFVDGRDRRPSDYITTLQYSLLHDANTSLDAFWPFRHHAFTLLQPYIHKLGRSGVFLISAPSPLQLRSSIQRAEPLFSVTLLSMSGITESNAGIHTTRQPSDQEKQLIDDVLCLYQLKPSHQAYSHYAENAVFHDPVSIARGLDSIKSQFNGMPKLFARALRKVCLSRKAVSTSI